VGPGRFQNILEDKLAMSEEKKATSANIPGTESGRDRGTRKQDLEAAEKKRDFQEKRAADSETISKEGSGGDKHTLVKSRTPSEKAQKVAKKKKKKVLAEFLPPAPEVLQRRTMLRAFGWTGLATYFTFLAGMVTRFFWPRVLFEPPTSFIAGFPSEFSMGEVNTNYQNAYRVWMIREVTGMYALIAKCTHLGCTPVWLDSKNKFKCPCHGSGYTKAGINFEGPAPRPLERATIKLLPDGRIFVDKARVFRQERGEWEKFAGDGATLQV
jgi:cytochrome b6-f complex iron-sulfur subunit